MRVTCQAQRSKCSAQIADLPHRAEPQVAQTELIFFGFTFDFSCSFYVFATYSTFSVCFVS